MERSKEMQRTIDKISKEIFGISNTETVNTGLCIQCKEPALPKCYSEAGRKEFTISGMCEECFDNMFKE